MAGNILNIGDYLKVRVWTALAGSGQAAVNNFVLNIQGVGSPAATDLDAAIFIDGVLAPMFKAILSSTAEYRGVQTQVLKSTQPYAARYTEQSVNANAGAGAISGNLLPHQTAGLMSFQTGMAGPANRGRLYTPFIGSTSDTGGGSPSNTYQTGLTAIASAISTVWNISNGGRTANLIPVIMHRKNKAGTIPGPSAIISASVSVLWATQRRRGSFGRLNKSPI